MKFTPYPYQEHATQHVIDNPAAGLLLEMALGKTVSTLTAIDKLVNEYMDISKVLVIAPLRVAEDVWSSECQKWDHLQHLRISKVLGNERQRKEALKRKADIYVINRENVPWLVAQYGTKFPFDMVVIDESSSFKNPSSHRFKALRMIRPVISRVVILTGTPIPNGLLDLWSQVYLLDMGQRLGKTITSYRDKYFIPGKRNGHVVYEYNLKSDKAAPGPNVYEKEIYDRIGDICISMKTADYLDLPPTIHRTVQVRLSDADMGRYLEFEKKQVLQLTESEEITAQSAGALTTKLLQFAGGALYGDERAVHEVHNAKLDILEELIESANGQPVLICYWFQHELERILHRLKAYKPVVLKTAEDSRRWNAKEIPVMLGHPASMGHGLNLQHGGNHMIWYGPTYNLELYQQACARLPRPGQEKSVIIRNMVAMGTIDEKVMLALEEKDAGQEALMRAVKALVQKYKN